MFESRGNEVRCLGRNESMECFQSFSIIERNFEELVDDDHRFFRELVSSEDTVFCAAVGLCSSEQG
jgi:hypothetical protein